MCKDTNLNAILLYLLVNNIKLNVGGQCVLPP